MADLVGNFDWERAAKRKRETREAEKRETREAKMALNDIRQAFERASSAAGMRLPPRCEHECEWVNAGFQQIVMVCRHCDAPMEMPAMPAAPEMTVVPPVPRFIRLPLLRGFTEVQALFELARRHDAVIAGGYGRFCASPNPGDDDGVGDVDVFPGRKGSAKLIADELRERGYELGEETEFSYTLKPPPDAPRLSCGYGGLAGAAERHRWSVCQKPVQVVKSDFLGRGGWRGVGGFNSFENLAAQVLATFDMSIVRVALLGSGEALADERFWDDEVSRLMRIDGWRSLPFLYSRLAKYAKKGYSFSHSDIMDLYDANALRIGIGSRWRNGLDDKARGAVWDKLSKIAAIRDCPPAEDGCSDPSYVLSNAAFAAASKDPMKIKSAIDLLKKLRRDLLLDTGKPGDSGKYLGRKTPDSEASVLCKMAGLKVLKPDLEF